MIELLNTLRCPEGSSRSFGHNSGEPMPRRANDERDNQVTAKSVSKDDGWVYECPKCGGDMSVAGGAETAVRKHFRHRPGKPASTTQTLTRRNSIARANRQL